MPSPILDWRDQPALRRLIELGDHLIDSHVEKTLLHTYAQESQESLVMLMPNFSCIF